MTVRWNVPISTNTFIEKCNALIHPIFKKNHTALDGGVVFLKICVFMQKTGVQLF